MRQVSKEEFFAALYADPRDIMPAIVGEWQEPRGYLSVWKDKAGRLFGRSQGGEFWLAQ